jgi:hypothetical protein
MDTAEIKRPNQNDAIQEIILEEHRKLATVRKMTVRREEFLDHMTFVTNERTLYRETLGPLIGVKEDWRADGASEAEIDLSAFDYVEAIYYDCGAFTGYYGPDQSEIISNDATELVYRNFMGIRHKLVKESSTLGHPMAFPVKTREDWERIKPRYQFCEGRIPAEIKANVEKMRDAGHVIVATIPGGYDEIRVLVGDEASLMGPYTQPDLLNDILDTIGATAARVLDLVTREVPIDMLLVHEDMAGKSGPLWGPKQVEELMVPYYRRCWEVVRARGGRLFNIDSDGDCMPIMASLIKGGINMFHPCEPGGNMDMVALRRQYGNQLAIEGGIDKFALMAGFAEIEAELERVVPEMVRTGGCVLGLDHRIPQGVSIANYRYYLEKLNEIITRVRCEMAA